MLRSISFFLISTATTLFSQANISLHAGSGISLIYNNTTKSIFHLYTGGPVSATPKISHEFGSSFHYNFKKTSMEVGILYSHIQSINKETDFGMPPLTEFTEEIRIENFRRLKYLGLPALINLNYRKFCIGGGIQSQFTLDVNERKTLRQAPFIQNQITPILNDRTITSFDIGFIGQLNFKANSRIALKCKLYWGLKNINNSKDRGVHYEFYQIESPILDRKLKNRQLIISLQYKLFKVADSKKGEKI